MDTNPNKVRCETENGYRGKTILYASERAATDCDVHTAIMQLYIIHIAVMFNKSLLHTTTTLLKNLMCAYKMITQHMYLLCLALCEVGDMLTLFEWQAAKSIKL